MIVVWRDSAADDLERIDEWLTSIEGANPSKVRKHIGATVSLLERLGDIGRPAPISGLRELPVRKAPYVIVYALVDAIIEVVAIYHTAQDR